MTAPALEIVGVSVVYPDGPSDRTVLDGLDLVVEPGELVVVSGPSGSGKTTLLTVAGLLGRPDSGDVLVGGVSTSRLSGRQRTAVRRDHIAFVFQSANLLPPLRAIEQLELVGHLRGESRRAATERATELLAALDLSDRASQLPSQLSGGERQRVGIARALMAEPSVLLADEPTASLDPERAATVAGLLVEAARSRGIAVLVVAHDDATRRTADRHLELRSGRLRALAATDGPAREAVVPS